MGSDLLTVAAVGAGRMGRGIAAAFAYAGHDASLIDLKDRSADESRRLGAEARAEIAADLEFLTAAAGQPRRDADSALARIRIVDATSAGEAMASADLLFEGVPETMPAKAAAFEAIGAAARPDAIIASTTSTIDADALAPLIASPQRFLNAHWLNPALLMPLVELSPAATTDPATTARLRAILTAMGKIPVVCRASPGYIVPRIQALAMNEAARLVEEGVASAEDVDLAVRVGFGLRFAVLGLLEFIDWGGCDILSRASGFLSDGLNPARFAAPAIVADNMEEQRRGLVDGKGFYDYADVDVAAYRRTRLHELVALLGARGLMPRPAA